MINKSFLHREFLFIFIYLLLHKKTPPVHCHTAGTGWRIIDLVSTTDNFLIKKNKKSPNYFLTNANAMDYSQSTYKLKGTAYW